MDLRWLSNAGRGALSADDGGPTAMGPSRRRRPPTSRARSPRGNYPPAISTHHSAVRDARGDWKAGGPARGDAGTPPPVSLAIGPLVARAASSAPRSTLCALLQLFMHQQFIPRSDVFVVASDTPCIPIKPDQPEFSQTRKSVLRDIEDTCTSGQPAGLVKSGAPTMPPGRRGGRWRGTQAEGPPRHARRAPRLPIASVSMPTGVAGRSAQAGSYPGGTEHVTWGGTAVARDPVPSAPPSSADNAASPAFSSQRDEFSSQRASNNAS